MGIAGKLKKMKFTLVEKIKEGEDITTFVFSVGKHFSYLPGQFIYLTLPKLNYPDERGNTRTFTLSSSPTEMDESKSKGRGIVKITTKLREGSGFKKTLFETEIGSTVSAEGPNGTFILDESEKEKKHIFVAGGIGITPFRSMLKYKFDKALEGSIHLLYSVANLDTYCFGKELEGFNGKLGFTLTTTVTHEENTKLPERYLREKIDAQFIQKHVESDAIHSSTWWVCGPPAMTKDIKRILVDLGVNNIVIEEFEGY